MPEPGALSGPDGIDGSSDLISSPLEKHRRELTNTIAGRGNEGRGRGEDSEEAEELLEHLDGSIEDTKVWGNHNTYFPSIHTTNGKERGSTSTIFDIH